jgi:hypothetical protein
MASPLKAALEDLLRARRLVKDAPPLRGEDRRFDLLPSGIDSVDGLLGGGFPRGQVSEVHGPLSSGRTGLLIALLARATGAGALAAWVDTGDHFDPASASSSGVDLSRLLWLRGEPNARPLPRALSALGTLLGSGLFELLVLDLAGLPATEVRRLPAATWIRLQRILEGSPAALVLLADSHLASSPAGVSLALAPARPVWSGTPGPGRLLRGLAAEARGRVSLRPAPFQLQASA